MEKKIVKKQWTNASMILNPTYRKYQQKKENVWNILPTTFIFRLAKFLNLWYSKVFPFLKEVPLENK